MARYGRRGLRALLARGRRLATISFSALFHLIGAIFRRPVVVGLVYVFFFEALVGSLPGSLKLLSLTFYARCLMYNAAETAGYPVEMLEVSQTVTSPTAWAVLSFGGRGTDRTRHVVVFPVGVPGRHLSANEVASDAVFDHRFPATARARFPRRHAHAAAATHPRGLSVAISREAGARGATIARKVGELVGWQVFDQEGLDYLVQDDTAREQLSGRGALHQPEPGPMPTCSSPTEPTNSHPTRTQSAMIRILLAVAARGDAVIVGRGAGFLLPAESTVHVRVVAPFERRVAYFAQSLRLSREEAAAEVRVRDDRRAEFLKRTLNRDPADPTGYDAVVNADRLGLEGAAQFIAWAIRTKQMFDEIRSAEDSRPCGAVMSAFADFRAHLRGRLHRDLAVVLGSGLGDVAADFRESASIPFRRCPRSGPAYRSRPRRASGCRALGRNPSLLFLGRLHFYEGHPQRCRHRHRSRRGRPRLSSGSS